MIDFPGLILASWTCINLQKDEKQIGGKTSRPGVLGLFPPRGDKDSGTRGSFWRGIWEAPGRVKEVRMGRRGKKNNSGVPRAGYVSGHWCSVLPGLLPGRVDAPHA